MWTTVTYRCGHTTDVQIVGKKESREREVYGYTYRDCPECGKAAAVKAAEENGLPQLVGTDKQIAWANTIRAAKLKALKEIADKTEQLLAQLPQYLADKIAEGGNEETLRATAKIAEAKGQAKVNEYTQAKAQTSASWWIDHR